MVGVRSVQPSQRLLVQGLARLVNRPLKITIRPLERAFLARLVNSLSNNSKPMPLVNLNNLRPLQQVQVSSETVPSGRITKPNLLVLARSETVCSIQRVWGDLGLTDISAGTTGGTFGTGGAFGTNTTQQQQPATGLFGQPVPTTGAFGALGNLNVKKTLAVF